MPRKPRRIGLCSYRGQFSGHFSGIDLCSENATRVVSVTALRSALCEPHASIMVRDALHSAPFRLDDRPAVSVHELDDLGQVGKLLATVRARKDA